MQFHDTDTSGTVDEERYYSPLATFEYDGRNFRIEKSAGGVDLAFFYNESQQLLEERRGADEDPLNQYVWDLRYIDAPLVRFHDANTNGSYGDTGDNILYYLNDANMNVTGLVDASTGAVVERYHYDPYGKVLYLDGSWNLLGTQASAFENDYLYTGRRLDAETDLFYYRARYYDTSLGRFISRDPIGYGDGPNLYKYVGGRPTMRVDPQGLAENGTLVLQGAGAGSIGAEVALAGRTLVQIGGEPFYVSSSGPSGVWSPKNSTTAFFVYKKSNPSKMYRLDYHSLPTGSNGPGVWHHNQKGVNRYAGLRATNHSVTTSSKFTGRALTVLKWGGRGVFVVSVGMSAVDIYYAESKARAVTKTVGGFAGAYAGGWAGAKGGAATGVFIAGVVGQAGPQLATPEEIVTVPAGGIIGGFLGGIGGGILGAFIGTEVAETVYDWMFTPLEKEEWIVVCEAGPTLDTGYGGFLEPGDY